MTAPKSTRLLGQRGEALAAAFLRQRGYEIVAANWRCPHGELDLVARQDDTLVFVEVRTRHADSTEVAFASITPAKQARLIALAQAYLAEHKLEQAAWRVDVVAIALPYAGTPIIEHAEDALGW